MMLSVQDTGSVKNFVDGIRKEISALRKIDIPENIVSEIISQAQNLREAGRLIDIYLESVPVADSGKKTETELPESGLN